jgi:hypothetical protein
MEKTIAPLPPLPSPPRQDGEEIELEFHISRSHPSPNLENFIDEEREASLEDAIDSNL